MHTLSNSFFFFNDTATTEIYTLSLHDALPIYWAMHVKGLELPGYDPRSLKTMALGLAVSPRDRKSTRLNSSHLVISYAVFCLKKKNHPSTIFMLTFSLFVPETATSRYSFHSTA